MSPPTSNPVWRALAAEAGIAADQIGEGATLLSKLSAEYTYSFARASFPLSIGFERACKLALQVDARLTNGTFLGRRQMMDFGHKLNDLLRAVDDMNQRRVLHREMPNTAVHQAIVGVLTDFATNGRYHHLDYLAGQSGTVDPGKQWWDTVVVPILDLHYDPDRRRRDEAMARELGSIVDGFSAIAHTHVSGATMDSMVGGMQARSQIEAAIPWVRVYALQIARWIASTFTELSFAAHRAGASEIPDLQEFFAPFNNDDSYFRSRKAWRPKF